MTRNNHLTKYEMLHRYIQVLVYLETVKIANALLRAVFAPGDFKFLVFSS